MPQVRLISIAAARTLAAALLLGACGAGQAAPAASTGSQPTAPAAGSAPATNTTAPALAAQPAPNFPRLRALALFGRRTAERAESLAIAGVQKPAHERTRARPAPLQ